MKTDFPDGPAAFGLAATPGAILVRKLGRHSTLDAAASDAIDRMLEGTLLRLPARATIAEEGAPPSEIHLLVTGWACRFVATDDGRRRIVALYLPGDLCDFETLLLPRRDHPVATIGAARIAAIDRAALEALMVDHPAVARALWRDSLATAAIQRAWTINVGHRSARRRLAHLLCELHVRLSLVGLVEDGACELPLTQSHLADACAMTAIHTNRALQEMRRDALLSLEDGRLRIHDRDRMAVLAGFDPAYLG